jgi:sec-independent protein translocase protein TatA
MVGDILQPTHLLFILVVALLVLGPKRLPEVGRTLGNGMRDFRSAINGESHEDRQPHAYVEPEPEPDPVPGHDSDASENESAGFDAAGDETDTYGSAAPEVSLVVEDPGDTAAVPASALHEHQLDPQAAGDDLYAPAATENLHPPAATGDVQAADDLRAPAATDDPNAVPAPVAAASGNGFASALASSRQRAVDDGEPAAGDE